MKTFIILLLFSACLADPILAPRNAGAELMVDTMEFGLHAGFRLDQIDWNIAGYNGVQYINVLSELDWEDLEIWELGATAKLAVGSSTAAFRPYVRGSLDYGWINDGTTRDSDYYGNDRTMEAYRWISDSSDDNVFDSSIGLGIEKDFWQDKLTLGLLGGYSYHEQNLRLTNGMQVIPDSISIAGLNSTYESRWQGPFAGIDLVLRPLPHFSLFGSVEYHWADFEAEADWNLRSDLAHPVSFLHKADNGDCLAATLRGSYLFSKYWALDLAWVYRDFSAGDGVDLTFLASSSTISTELNEVTWQSSAVTVGLTYLF